MKKKSCKNKRTSFLVLAIFVLAIFVFGKRNILEDNILQAAEMQEVACKGPADAMLLIDRSASMNESSKFSIAKSSSAGFIDKLFSTTPNAEFSPYNYHQVGLAAFNQNIDSEPLTQNGSYIKDIINSGTGILSQAIGYRNTADAIKEAKIKLNASLNNFSTKTMIILTDGPPANLTLAKEKSDQAKSAGLRIISVGLELDGIVDEIKRTEAEDFIKYAASSPADCYYVSDSESELADCNSISSAMLRDALDNVYNTITSSLCDNSSPSVNISRIPTGTLYSYDKLTIKSTAVDDTGFSSHKIIWSDSWPNNLQEVVCSDLIGTTINCDTGELGPFAANETINYRSIAKDVNNNETSISLPDPKSVTVAAVSLTVPASLNRNTNNNISVTVSDPDGKANLDEFYIRVDNNGVKRIDETSPSSKMSCSGSGSNYTCSYNFNPGCAGAGIYPVDAVDIYIYAKSGTGYHPNPIASQLNKTLGLPSEGIPQGNCSDGIDNNCNGLTDSAETVSCDGSGPIIVISRTPSGDVYNDDHIIFVSTAADANGIKQHIIYYKKEGDVSWTTAFNCLDAAPVDGNCDGTTQSVASISATVGPFSAGKKIYYYSKAIDYSGNNNTTSTATTVNFVVKSRECEAVGDLGNCNVTPGGKCCGGVCNAITSNPSSYNINYCAQKACDGTSLKWIAANNGSNCSDGANSDGCYHYGTFFDGGCENRDYSCSGGYCVPAVSNRNGDYCVGGGSLILNDYECVGGSCALSPNPAIENDICDVILDSLSANAYNSDNVLISGSSGTVSGEVLDDKTNKVSLISNVTDINGISGHKIYWQKNGGGWSDKNCGACPDGNTCSCDKDIGPYNVGDVIRFYAWAKDNGPNHTVSQTSTYSFTVRDSDCYNIPGGNKASLTACGPGSSTSGKCCGGSCDTSVSSTSYNEECRVDACSGTDWIYAAGNEGNLCGAAGTCFPYYTGCISGNRCASGYCSPDPTGKQVDLCAGNLFNNYGCSGGVCGLISGGLNCSSSGNSDSDDVACNCDCNGYDIDEKVYSSLSFDGKDDYTTIPDSSTMRVSSYTVSVWVKPSLQNEYWKGIVGKPGRNYNIWLGNANTTDGGFIHHRFYDSSGWNAGCPDTPVGSILTDVWTNVIITNDGVKCRTYINGVESTSGNISGSLVINSDITYIGRNLDGSAGNYFKGMIDEVRIYNRALYPEEVQDHYNGIFSSNTGLVGYWNFDEGTGEIANDGSGNGNNGTLSNVDGILYNMNNSDWVSGKYGTGIDLDGDNDYVNISSGLGDPSEMSLEFWFYVSESDKNRTQYFMDGRNGGNWWFLQSYDPSGTGNINFNNNVKIDSSGWNAGQWNHLILATNSSSSKIYINGNLKSTGLAFDPNIGANMRIGTRYTNSSYFRGKFDEVRIYNRALLYDEDDEANSEIYQHYMGVYTDNSGLVGYWNFNEGSGATAYDSSGNGPKWIKYYHGSTSGASGNVPIYWQVCADSKNNDCDGAVDEYNIGDIGNAQCDGIVDGIFVQAAAKNRSGIQKIFIKPTTEVFDIDMENVSNDFTLSTINADDFGIKQTVIEWTIDNWANIENKTCSSSACYVCVDGGTCENESTGVAESAGNKTLTDNDKLWVIDEWENGAIEIISGTGTGQTRTIISNTEEKITVDSNWSVNPDAASQYKLSKKGDVVNSLLLSAGNTFTYRTCAWDFNNNKSCSSDYSFVVLSSNLAPVLSGPSVWDPDFCVDGLKYILKWVYTDADGDAQASYEIQVKEGDNNFSDTGALVINTIKYLSSDYYQIISSDFEPGKEIKYGNEDYYWRVRATDDRSGGYALTSDWIEGPSFTTPLHEYPSVDFSSFPDCLYGADYVYTGAESRCNFGEDILFSDNSLFASCNNPDSSQCKSASASKCDINILSCAPCDDNSQCAKFGADYTCQDGICEPPVDFNCAADDDCSATNISRCNTDSGLCVSCDDDLQCAKFNAGGDTYICYSDGMCGDSNRRKWYFYGDDSVPPNSADPYPVNNYVISVVDSYSVILKVKDISGNLCSKTKNVLLGGKKYPKWNEVSPTND